MTQQPSSDAQTLEAFLLQDFIIHVHGDQEDIRAKSASQRQAQLIEVIRYFCDQKLSLNLREEQQKEGSGEGEVEAATARLMPVFGCFELRQYYKS